MSIEQKIATLLAESKAAKLAEQVEAEEIVSEAKEKPSIAHLAADHYHHIGMASDYNDEGTDKQKAAAKKKANDILAKVKEHHGEEAAKDVAKHSEHAFEHDNSTTGSGKKEHAAFADKHLGGKGSAEHKKYKSQLDKHGYETDSGSGMHTEETEEQEDNLEEGIGDAAEKVVKGIKKVAGVATGAVGAAVGAIDGAVKGARKNYATQNEELTIDVSADVDALVNGEELSEEFKTKAATIFEAAIITRVKQEVSRLEEEFEARLEEAVAKNQEGLVEQVDGYLGYVAEQWMAQNELALERGMKAEILEGFVSGLKGLFEEHYIEVPEERFDVLGSMELQIEELEERLNEQVATNIEMSKTLAEAKRTEIIKTVSEGLTVTESEKFNSLAEELSFEDAESFETKVKTIRENYFSGKTVSGSKIDSVVTDEPVEQLTEQVKPKLDGRMSAYLSALSNK